MKEFHCGSLVPGCRWSTRHGEEAEVIRRAVEHLSETHRLPVRDTTVEAIRLHVERVRDAA